MEKICCFHNSPWVGRHTAEFALKLLGIEIPNSFTCNKYYWICREGERYWLEETESKDFKANIRHWIYSDLILPDAYMYKNERDLFIKKYNLYKNAYDHVTIHEIPTWKNFGVSLWSCPRLTNLFERQFQRVPATWVDNDCKIIVAKKHENYWRALIEFMHAKDQYGSLRKGDKAYRFFVDPTTLLKVIEYQKGVCDEVWYFDSIDDMVNTVNHVSAQAIGYLFITTDWWMDEGEGHREIYGAVEYENDEDLPNWCTDMTPVEINLGKFDNLIYEQYLLAAWKKLYENNEKNFCVSDMGQCMPFINGVVDDEYIYNYKKPYNEGSWNGAAYGGHQEYIDPEDDFDEYELESWNKQFQEYPFTEEDMTVKVCL